MQLITLTKRRVDGLKPKTFAYDVFDGALRGFAVRVHPSGRKCFRFKFVQAGRQRVITIGEYGAPWTVEAARTQARILRGQAAAGLDPNPRPIEAAAPVTVEQLIERWLDEGPTSSPNKRRSSWAHDASRLRRHIIPLLGAKPAAALRRCDIERAQRDIDAGATAADIKTGKRGRAIVRGGAAAARGAIVSLSACLTWAVSQDLLPSNQAAKVKKLAAAKRERFLSDAEVVRLLEAIVKLTNEGALKTVFADALRLLLLSGARKREITELAWEEVNFERAVIKLEPGRAKNGAKAIVLSGPALQLINQRPRAGRFVFPSPVEADKPIVGLQKVWERVRAAAGLDDVRLHDLRHSWASFAASDGASLLLIAKGLGHAQTATTERYAHVNDDPIRQVADRVGARIMAHAGHRGA